MPITDPSIIKAEAIYRDAQNELRIATEFYHRIYVARRNSAAYGMPLTAKQKAQIEDWSRESTNHRRKHKTRMAKIVWDPKVEMYRMKPGKGKR
jgi:hypothetical protein